VQLSSKRPENCDTVQVGRVLLGRSVLSRSIDAYVFGKGVGGALVLGGMHGDEPKAVDLARAVIARLVSNAGQSAVVVVPVVNPDGFGQRLRRNASGVDINRNFPTRNWQPGDRRSRNYPGLAAASEPETQAVMRAVERWSPGRIMTLHSIDKNRFCNNYDGPAEGLARRLARGNGYPVRASIGYPTPGSFGTWAGAERDIAVVTLELPSHHSKRRCRFDNLDALVACCER